MEDLTGKKLGNCRIIETVGEGGMAAMLEKLLRILAITWSVDDAMTTLGNGYSLGLSLPRCSLIQLPELPKRRQE